MDVCSYGKKSQVDSECKSVEGVLLRSNNAL